MRVLFLDIDGVCNSERYAKERAKGGMLDIDPVAAARVNRIIDATGCAVVLSSTWRLSEDLREQVRKNVCEFIDVTADYPGKKRGIEVQVWLNQHPAVRQYAILDDDDDFLPGQHLFDTTFAEGLTDDIADQVIKHFVGANELLDLPRNKMSKAVIAFDIDGTLRCNCTDTCQDTNTEVVDLARSLKKVMKNTKLIAWSGGGADYAQRYVDKYPVLRDIFGMKCYSKVAYLQQHGKPDIAVDDIQDTAIGILNLIVGVK